MELPAIEMVPVESAAISAIGHDLKSKTLRLQFSSGGTYDYRGVAAQKHKEMMAAASKGSFYHAFIRPHHEFKRVDG